MAKGGFPGLGGAGGMAQLMQQAQKVQKMQQDIQNLQEEFDSREFTASAGGGAVSATVLGTKSVQSVKIDPACMATVSPADPDDIEMLEDLVVSAVNAALSSAKEMLDTEMAKITGGINLPF